MSSIRFSKEMAVATLTDSPEGIPLASTAVPIEVKVDNLNKIYVAVAVDGEGVSYLYYR